MFKYCSTFDSTADGNIGPVAGKKSLHDSVFAMEELEESAKLNFLLRGQDVNLLGEEQIAELQSLSPRA